jgi:hypothetical protein
MERKKKIELLNKIAEGTASPLDLLGYVIIMEKNGKKFLSGREITENELDQIKVQKIFLVDGKGMKS